jgi:hypothetical protein
MKIKKTIQEMIEVMEHWSNGGKVEYKSDYDYDWQWASKPRWNWVNCDYRIAEGEETLETKPEIKVDKYVGKIAINKIDTTAQSIILKINDYYRVSGYSYITYITIKELKKDWYVQGEDF